MRKFVGTFVVIGALTVFGAGESKAISLDFNAVGTLAFDGAGNFSIVNNSGNPVHPRTAAFQIYTSDGVGDALWDYGSISGVFTIGQDIGDELANVMGTGLMTINDGKGYTVSADVNWKTIGTKGTAGGLNILGEVDLTSLTYTGYESDWLKFVECGRGVATISFQTAGQQDLDYFRNNYRTTTFSGSFKSVPDQGSMMLFIGMSMVGIGMLRRKFTI